MASIGGVSVDFWHGPDTSDVQPLGGQAMEIQRAGVSGSDLMLTGSQGEPFTLLGRATYADNAARLAGHASFNALRGRAVSVVDNHGDTWSRMLVRGLRVKKMNRAGTVGGNGNYHLDLQFELKAI